MKIIGSKKIALLLTVSAAGCVGTPTGDIHAGKSLNSTTIDYVGDRNEYSAGVAIADFNRDSLPDIFIVNGRHWPRNDLLYLRDENSAFSDAIIIEDGPSTGYGACVADIDGDGDSDILVARDGASGDIFLNSGSAAFRRIKLGSPRAARDCLLNDFDGDGIIDALLTERGGETSVFFGPLISEPVEKVVYTGNAVGAAGGDLNGDGLTDIALTIRGGGTLAVIYSEVNRSFSEPVLRGRKDVQSRAATIADIDQDGDNDIVAAVVNGKNLIFKNEGGEIASGSELPGSSSRTGALAVADLDSDGRLDIVFGNNGKNSVFLNKPNGFERVVLPDPKADTYDVAIGDVNSDGFPDIVFANSNRSNTLIVSTEQALIE